MIDRIFIIGDSFCDGVMHSIEKKPPYKQMHWVNYVDYHYKDTEVINDAFGSRDLQSMIDYWIKLFPILTENDRVIIGFSDAQRQRIPIEDEKDYRKLEWSGGVCKNMFLTRQWWSAYQDFKTTSASNAFSENDMDKMLDFLEVMNQSKTTSQNYKEVIESLYKVAPCKTYLFSWQDYHEYNLPKAYCVEDRADLTGKLGGWTTMHQLAEETDGEEGLEHDQHWDYRTMESFGNYVINEIK
jgi:hypothetical protein